MAVKGYIDEFHFTNNVDEYLDVRVDNHSHYIIINTNDSNGFSIDSEKEIDEICKKLKELLAQSKTYKRRKKKI